MASFYNETSKIKLQQLQEETGASFTKCKYALDLYNGNYEKAKQYILQKETGTAHYDY